MDIYVTLRCTIYRSNAAELQNIKNNKNYPYDVSYPRDAWLLELFDFLLLARKGTKRRIVKSVDTHALSARAIQI